jgi:hypothetical protein
MIPHRSQDSSNGSQKGSIKNGAKLRLGRAAFLTAFNLLFFIEPEPFRKIGIYQRCSDGIGCVAF